MFSSGWHLARLLRESNPEIHIRATHDLPDSLVLAAADERGGESPLQGDDYVTWALEQCHHHGIDVFWPHHRLGAIADRLPAFTAAGVAVVCAAPDGATYRILADKVSQLEVCRADEVARIPVYEAVTTIPEFRAAVDRLAAGGHTVCCKPARAEGATGFRIVTDEAPSLFTPAGVQISRAEAERALAVAGEPFPALLVSEYLHGFEWSIDCVAWKGELAVAVARRKVDGRVQRVEPADDLIEVARRAAATFNLSYTFNVQVREDAGGTPTMLEINPRMAAGTSVSCAGSGVNLPGLALDYALTGATSLVAPPVVPAAGVTVSRIEQMVVLTR